MRNDARFLFTLEGPVHDAYLFYGCYIFYNSWLQASTFWFVCHIRFCHFAFLFSLLSTYISGICINWGSDTSTCRDYNEYLSFYKLLSHCFNCSCWKIKHIKWIYLRTKRCFFQETPKHPRFVSTSALSPDLVWFLVSMFLR